MEKSETLIPQADWNFGGVPDSELVACCYWEYARESSFIRDTLRRYREEWMLPPDHFRDKPTEPAPAPGFVRKDRFTNWRQLERIQSIGHAADVFVCGCAFEKDMLWQSQDPGKPNYRHPDAPPLTGSFPAPWQSLDPIEREYRAHIRTDVGQFQMVPVQLGHWSWGKEIATYCEGIVREQHEARGEYERKFMTWDKNGVCRKVQGAPAEPEFKDIRPGLRRGFGETLILDINWKAFTDDEIASYFRRWVKHARPKQAKAPSRRGHKPGDFRANLTRLAVMRILAHFRPAEVVDPRKGKFPEVWETKQFSGSKWHNITKWHDARREAGRLFRELFPFLPPDEWPLSWDRRLPGK